MKSSLRREGRVRGAPAGLLTVAVALASILIGCQSAPARETAPRRFNSQPQAGTGHVAWLGTTRWEDHVASLSPNFTLSADDALKAAGPTTAVMERKLLDMLKVVARMAGPAHTTTSTDTTVSKDGVDADGKSTKSRERTTETTTSEESGGATAFTPSYPGSASASSLGGVGPTPAVGRAALAQYSLATALMQEVQLLNRHITDAAFREGYRAYVVRMQLSLMPKIRNAPYDAYSTISFFPGEQPSDHVCGAHAAPAAGVSRALPVVIPLLVTNDMEAAVASDSAEVVRQYALALSAVIKGFSVSGDVERYTDELVSSVTRDYNSLYTVARQTDNSIRVRIGARLHSSGNHYMVPQAHTVTVLLLAPDSLPPGYEIPIEGFTEFVDVETGQPLASGGPGRHRAELDKRLSLFELSTHVTEKERGKLLEAVRADDYEAFCKRLRPSLLRKHFGEGVAGRQHPTWEAAARRTMRRLHAAINLIKIGGQYSSTRATLPGPRPCALPQVPFAAVTAIDDAKSTMSVELRPVRGSPLSVFGARLRVRSADGSVAFVVPAQQVRFTHASEALLCTFPSSSRVQYGGKTLAAWLGTGANRATAHLEVDPPVAARNDCTSRPPRLYPVSIVTVLSRPLAAKPPLTLLTLPAIRSCSCTASSFTVLIRRAQADASKTGIKVPLLLSFLARDGKTPTTGRLASATVGGPPLPRKPAEVATNRVTIPMAKGVSEVAVQLEVDQLSDGSSLTLSAHAAGISKIPATKKIAVYVSTNSRNKCKGEAPSQVR